MHQKCQIEPHNSKRKNVWQIILEQKAFTCVVVEILELAQGKSVKLILTIGIRFGHEGHITRDHLEAHLKSENCHKTSPFLSQEGVDW